MPSFRLRTEAHKLARTLKRASVPFVVFAAFLAGIMALSTSFFLPRLQQVPLHGSVFSVSALEDYEQSLHASITVLEQKRDALLSPERDAFYELIRAQHDYDFPLLVLQEAIYTALLEVGSPEQIVIERFTYDKASRSVRLRGNVQHVGEYSVRLSASFLDALSALPIVERIGATPLSQKEDEVHGAVSPFDIELFLTPAN